MEQKIFISKEKIHSALRPAEIATTMLPAFYSDSTLFEIEREQIFLRGWWVVGHVSELPNQGDFLTADIAGEPIVVVRDKENDVRVLSNVCVHRNFPVAHGRGNCSILRCEYHNWIYNLDGSLRGAPLMGKAQGFDAKQFGLKRFSSFVWQGFIFMSFDSSAKSIEPDLGELLPIFRRHQVEDSVYVSLGKFEIDSNWKNILDNFAENYHTAALHAKSLEPLIPSAKTIVAETEGKPYTYYTLPSAEGKSLLDPEKYGFTGGFLRPGTLDPIDLTAAIGGVTFPANIWYFAADLLFTIEIFPQTVDKTTGRWGINVTQEALAAPDFEEKLELFKQRSQTVIDEDIRGISEIPRGKRSRFAQQAPISHIEKNLWYMHAWYLNQMIRDSRIATPD